VQQRRRAVAGRARLQHCFHGFVLNGHDLRCVFSQIAGIGDHERDRLADKAHALDRERPLIDGRFERNQERIGELANILAGDDCPDALLRERIRRLDADDARVSVR
jgi:hypothetical protein